LQHQVDYKLFFIPKTLDSLAIDQQKSTAQIQQYIEFSASYLINRHLK